MATGYRVRDLHLSTGERLPLLLNSTTGVPLLEPTMFVCSQLRTRNLAARTLAQALRSVMVALQILEHLRIDLDRRLDEGRILTSDEIDSLTALAGLKQENLDALLAAPSNLTSKRVRIPSIEGARMKRVSADLDGYVGPDTKAIRLLYIREYVEWFVTRRLLALDHRDPAHSGLARTLPVVVDALNERIPPKAKQDQVGMREGIDRSVQSRILAAIDPRSPKNPWKNKHVRARNRLIFLWLLHLGIRKGELLIARVGDVNLRANEVLVARRPDDPLDTRADPASTKTSDRLLRLDDSLAELTREYVHDYRRKVAGARKHPYLFVATGTGAPLSTSAVAKMFAELRTKVPDLPDDLTPHVLRYTWNDNFTELVDATGVEPEHEVKMRRQQMGWSDTSKMPEHYNKRHIKRKADAASVAMQKKAFSGGKL